MPGYIFFRIDHPSKTNTDVCLSYNLLVLKVWNISWGMHKLLRLWLAAKSVTSLAYKDLRVKQKMNLKMLWKTFNSAWIVLLTKVYFWLNYPVILTLDQKFRTKTIKTAFEGSKIDIAISRFGISQITNGPCSE